MADNTIASQGISFNHNNDKYMCCCGHLHAKTAAKVFLALKMVMITVTVVLHVFKPVKIDFNVYENWLNISQWFVWTASIELAAVACLVVSILTKNKWCLRVTLIVMVLDFGASVVLLVKACTMTTCWLINKKSFWSVLIPMLTRINAVLFAITIGQIVYKYYTYVSDIRKLENVTTRRSAIINEFTRKI